MKESMKTHPKEGYVSFAEKMPEEGMTIESYYVDQQGSHSYNQATLSKKDIEYIHHYKRGVTYQFWREVKKGGTHE